MSTIVKPFTFSPNAVISSSQMNANVSTFIDNFNGSINSDNIAAASLSNAKFADGAITTAKLANNSVGSSELGSDSVPASAIDWASTGSSGIWREELGRTTLTAVSGTLTVEDFPARRYLFIAGNIIGSGGDVTTRFQCNGDTGSTYARRNNDNGAESTGTAGTYAAFGGTNDLVIFRAYAVNFISQEKLFICTAVSSGAYGATAAPGRQEYSQKWANTSEQITSISLINGAAGQYGIGSELVILGHN